MKVFGIVCSTFLLVEINAGLPRGWSFMLVAAVVAAALRDERRYIFVVIRCPPPPILTYHSST